MQLQNSETIDENFYMVDVVIDFVITAVVTGDGAAKVCEVVGRCDRLCSDEC